MIKTKIVATLGPASDTSEMIEALLDDGVDVFRLNFSHGSLEGHAEVLARINAARARHGHRAAVMGDLCGPKIRIGAIAPEGQMLRAGERVVIRLGQAPGTAHEFGTNYDALVAEVAAGQRVLIDDGQIMLRVAEKHADRVVARVVSGGPVYSHKGVNLPDTQVRAPSITEEDWRCVDWAIAHELDYLALSFVRRADEIRQLKNTLRQAEADIKVIAKIEKPQAVAHLEEIVQAADGVLVARGDLGVEMQLAEVPLIQKRITALGRRLGKPVIVATQMLQSMIENATPTRAEINDVANAIFDFADAVMLSGETAVGKHPRAAVEAISQVAAVTEAYLEQEKGPRPRMESEAELLTTAAMARSVAQIVEDTAAKWVVCWTQTGSAGRLLSKARIGAPILALTSNRRIAQQMALHYGVIPRYEPLPGGISELVARADAFLLAKGWAQAGDAIVVVAGRPLGDVGTTNTILLHTVTVNSDHSDHSR